MCILLYITCFLSCQLLLVLDVLFLTSSFFFSSGFWISQTLWVITEYCEEDSDQSSSETLPKGPFSGEGTSAEFQAEALYPPLVFCTSPGWLYTWIFHSSELVLFTIVNHRQMCYVITRGYQTDGDPKTNVKSSGVLEFCGFIIIIEPDFFSSLSCLLLSLTVSCLARRNAVYLL